MTLWGIRYVGTKFGKTESNEQEIRLKNHSLISEKLSDILELSGQETVSHCVICQIRGFSLTSIFLYTDRTYNSVVIQ